MRKKQSFNDTMVKRTVLPAIYLWLCASGAVVYTGITKPDVVLTNLDGFIALIAIIGGVAAPGFSTIIRIWESEQTNDVDEIPAIAQFKRDAEDSEQSHRLFIEKQDNEHRIDMERNPEKKEDGDLK